MLGRQFEMLSVYAGESRRRRQPFKPAALLEEPLVVILDMDWAPSDGDPVRRAVEALATSKLLEVWRYSDRGAPSDVPRLSSGRRGTERSFPRGWLQITPQSETEGEGPRAVVTHVVEGSLRHDHHQAHFVWAHPDVWTPGVLYASEQEVHAALIRRALTESSELFISSRPGIVGATRGGAVSVGEGALASWETGAAILGRLARQSGDSIPVGQHQTAGEGLYYALAAEDLLPHLRDVIDVTLQRGVNPDHLLAFRGRITQTLLARDDLALALSTEQSSLREIDALDRVLIFTLAAFDELAHLASAAFGLQLSAPTIKWERKEFLLALRHNPAARGLAELFERTRRPAAVLRVLRYLRNMVHGTGLNELTVLTDPVSGPIASLSAPAPVRHDLDSALEMTAYRGWGVHFVDDRLFIDSEALADKVAFESFRLMDRTLEALEEAPFHQVGPPPSTGEFIDARVLRLGAADVGSMPTGGLCAQLGLLHARRPFNG